MSRPFKPTMEARHHPASPLDAEQEHGRTFRHYEGMMQEDDAVWHAPSGSLVAWFEDPNGYTSSLTQLE